MDENGQLSLYAKLEIDKMQSISNIQKAVKEIGDKTTVEVNGINFDMQKVAKDFNKVVSTAFQFNKDNILTGYTTTLKNEMGEILTLQSKFDKDGNAYVESSRAVRKELDAQKIRYEEIRAEYEKLGKLQVQAVNVSKKKKESLDEEIKNTQKLIREKEKALKTEGLTNNSLQNTMIEKQKLANERAIAQEEDRRNKKRNSAYSKLLKAMELIHKYEMQSVDANEKDLQLLERQKAVAMSMRQSAQGTINLGGLSSDSYAKEVAQRKEIYDLELKITKEKAQQKALEAEQKTLNAELIALDKQRIATERQLATVGNDKNARVVLENQLAEQVLTISQKKAKIDEKGLMTQQTENTLKQQQLDLDNKIALVQAKQLTNTQKEEKAVKKLIAETKRNMKLEIDNFLSKNSQFVSSDDEKAIEGIRKKLAELDATSLENVKTQITDLKFRWKETSSAITNTRLKEATNGLDQLGESLKKVATYVSGAMVIQKLWAMIGEGVEYVKELDEAYTDVAISMDISKKEFHKWTQDARKIAQANGLMTTSLMDMVKIYASSGDTIKQIEDRLAGTAMIQNITQWDAEKTTSIVNSIINQYKLLEVEIDGTTENIAGAIQYMGDVLVGTSNALQVDNVQGIKEMANAIDEAGGFMKEAGASMEWYMGVTGTLNEVMNATGSEVGNAIDFCGCV